MKRRLKRYFPNSDSLRANRWLQWMGPALHHPRIWHFSRRGVALGCAIGVFFGLLIPVAQIPLSAGAAVLLRASLPVAVGSTLVSNPLTFGPLYYAAYRLGAAVTGDTTKPVTEQSLTPSETGMAGWVDFWWKRLQSLGKPLIVGIAIMAPVASAAAYVLVNLLWRLTTTIAWRRRARGRTSPVDRPD